MRIPVLLTCLLAALLAALPVQPATAQDEEGGGATFDLFYNNLSDDGEWYNTPEYGYVWQPDIAYNNDKWRPYSDGYWAQTDSGWTWVSYENFGWATYHYGRWTRLKDTGWAWVPGYEWGPGWVSWRTNDDYVGWAPLPPKAERGVYEGKVVERRPAVRESLAYNDVEEEDDGYTSNVDTDYDIGPTNYCFVETRTFGAPVLGEVLLPPERNFGLCERTTNVTNIYYDRRGRDEVFVYNSGPDYNFISAHSERPIQRLQIEQRRDPGFLSQGLRAGGNPTQVRGGILQVAAPFMSRRPVNFQQVKPVRVKENLPQPQIVHGWSNSGAEPQNVDRLRQQFKEQARKAPAKAVQPREQLVQSLPPQQRVVTKSDLPTAPAKDMSADAVAARRAQRQQQRAAQGGPRPGQATPGVQPGAGAAPAQAGQPKAGGAPRPGALTDDERKARRDAAVKEREARDQARTNGQPAAAGQPGQPAQGAGTAGQKDTSPEAVAARRAQRQQQRAGQGGTPGQPVPANPPGATANGQPAQAKDQSEEAKAARRAQRQQERGNPTAPNQPQAEAAPPGNPAAQPKDPSDEARAARRAQRQQQRTGEGANGAQPAAPQTAAPATQPTDAAREARRTQRQQERAAQPQAQPQTDNADQEARRAQRQQQRAAQPQAQPQAQADPEREARRAQRQQERAAQPQVQPQQAQPQQADPEREARRNQRQQERAAQPQPQPQPQPQAQPQAGNAEREARRAQRQAEKGKPDDKPNQ